MMRSSEQQANSGKAPLPKGMPPLPPATKAAMPKFPPIPASAARPAAQTIGKVHGDGENGLKNVAM